MNKQEEKEDQREEIEDGSILFRKGSEHFSFHLGDPSDYDDESDGNDSDGSQSGFGERKERVLAVSAGTKYTAFHGDSSVNTKYASVYGSVFNGGGSSRSSPFQKSI